MIAAHSLVIVGRRVIAHVIDIDYAVMRVFVGQNHLVSGRFLYGLRAIIRLREIIIVEVALVLGPHVAQTEHPEGHAKHPAASKPHTGVCQDQSGAHKYEQARTKGGGAENVVPRRSQGRPILIDRNA